MKNFQQVIDKGQFLADHPVITDQKKAQQTVSGTIEEYLLKVLPVVSPFLLSIATGPFATVSALLQATSKGLGNTLEAKIKAAPHLQRHINNGVFGDSRIYEPVNIQNYKNAFNKLGKQGIRGLYKGNFTGVLLATSNAKLRENLYVQVGEQGFLNDQLKSSAFTVTTCTIADIITLPLMAAQSRLILQNSSTNFRTYSSFLSVWKKTKPKFLFSGGSILLLKNIIFNLSWIKLIPQSPTYSFIISTFASHILTYPFLTVLRQMQVSEPNVPMMMNRRQKIGQCCKRMWGEGGLQSFYRGFMAYGVVHLFMGALMVQANLRSGYFYQQ